MTEALERICLYIHEFSTSIERCRSVDSDVPFDLKNAYGALGRLLDRYHKERCELALNEMTALRKVFEEDVFIQGMMELRQVAEHVTRRPKGQDGPKIWTAANQPIQLTAETSALAVFPALVVTLPDVNKNFHRIDHIVRLADAERRIQSALQKASQ